MGTQVVNSQGSLTVLETPHVSGFPLKDTRIPLIAQEKAASRKVIPPPKPHNIDRRPREYLTYDEVTRLIQGAQRIGRHRYRDALMIHTAYRHGLRPSEVVGLKRNQIDFVARTLHVVRSKGGLSGPHPLQHCTIKGLRELGHRYPKSPYLFVSARGDRITRWRFGVIVARAGRLAGLNMPVHPHMLRHATGYKLANDGWSTRDIQKYLGHRCIENSVRYMELVPGRFERFWTD